MSLFEHPPLEATQVFGGVTPQPDFDRARAVIVPVPYERTTSYVTGTRHAPAEIVAASGQVELWDEETGTEPYTIGLYTVPEMKLSADSEEEALASIRSLTAELADTGKFLSFLGGEHSITPAIVETLAPRLAGLSVLQIDAHADMRPSYQGSRYSHASAMRRVVDLVPCTQVGIRSLSREESEEIPSLDTRIFYDYCMREDPDWIDRVVDGLGDRVYLTIDCDGLSPSIMPAVGTPEPGGLSWQEMTRLVRTLFARRTVVACDIVELCPIPGLVAPTFICAKLLYKLLAYRFAAQLK